MIKLTRLQSKKFIALFSLLLLANTSCLLPSNADFLGIGRIVSDVTSGNAPSIPTPTIPNLTQAIEVAANQADIPTATQAVSDLTGINPSQISTQLPSEALALLNAPGNNPARVLQDQATEALGVRIPSTRQFGPTQLPNLNNPPSPDDLFPLSRRFPTTSGNYSMSTSPIRVRPTSSGSLGPMNPTTSGEITNRSRPENPLSGPVASSGSVGPTSGGMSSSGGMTSSGSMSSSSGGMASSSSGGSSVNDIVNSCGGNLYGRYGGALTQRVGERSICQMLGLSGGGGLLQNIISLVLGIAGVLTGNPSLTQIGASIGELGAIFAGLYSALDLLGGGVGGLSTLSVGVLSGVLPQILGDRFLDPRALSLISNAAFNGHLGLDPHHTLAQIGADVIPGIVNGNILPVDARYAEIVRSTGTQIVAAGSYSTTQTTRTTRTEEIIDDPEGPPYYQPSQPHPEQPHLPVVLPPPNNTYPVQPHLPVEQTGYVQGPTERVINYGPDGRPISATSSTSVTRVGSR